MTVEHIERKGSHHGVAHGVLLEEVSAVGSWLMVPPCSPFVHQKADVFFRVFFVHDGTVALDHIFYLKAFAQCPVVLVVVEFG